MLKYKYQEKIKLLNDVEIEIKGLFPVKRQYRISIRGYELNIMINESFLDFLVDKYKFKEEKIKEDLIISNERKNKKPRKNRRLYNGNES